MCCCYILYSESKDRYYVGYTCDELTSRIKRHNQKSKGFTGSVNDWKLVRQELFQTKNAAMVREKQIKSWKSRNAIIDLIGNAEDH